MEHYNCDCNKKLPTNADFVIVGAGTAGAAAAKLLSKCFSVIVLEKGVNEDDNPLISDPLAAGILARGHINDFFAPWGHAVPTNTGRLFPSVNGLVDGGGSSVNGMQTVRGSKGFFKKLYDITEKPHWHPDNIFKIYKRMENFNGSADPVAHGFNGPIDVRESTDNEQASALFANAASIVANIPYNVDYNNKEFPLGSFTDYQLFQTPNKNRESSSTAYLFNLEPYDKCGIVYTSKCKNLYLYHNATVNNVVFDECKKVAKKVSATINGKNILFTANKGIIISSGFWSSTILQRSGIGEKKLLEDNCIKVIYDNPNVGKNSQNHILVTLTGLGEIPGVVTDPQALYTGGAFAPDPSTPENRERAIQYIGIASPGAYTVIGIPVVPKSKGTININNADPTKMGNYNFNYFTNPADMLTAIAMIKDMSAMLIEMGLTPINTFNNDVEIEQYILKSYNQTYHWAGTCSMGKNPDTSVTDGNFKVHGVDNLYVVDNSAYPVVPDGNTAYPAFLAGNIIAKLMYKKYCYDVNIDIEDKPKNKPYVKYDIPNNYKKLSVIAI